MFLQSICCVASIRTVAQHTPPVGLLGLILVCGVLVGCGGDESAIENFTEPVPAEGAMEIADHPDTKEDSVITLTLWDDAEKGWVGVVGSIIAVYSDGSRKISLRLRLGYDNREGNFVEKTGILPEDRSVVFRYKKLTKEAWGELYEKEKWAELMEGYITEDAFWQWERKQR